MSYVHYILIGHILNENAHYVIKQCKSYWYWYGYICDNKSFRLYTTYFKIHEQFNIKDKVFQDIASYYKIIGRYETINKMIGDNFEIFL